MSSNQHAQAPVVLIVDDEPSNIHALANLIKQDYQIRVAPNGSKALEIAGEENPPDLILLDVMMPEIDGYEVCRRLKDDPKTRNVPVIFVTALDAAVDEEKGLNLGASDYITRPFQPAVVRARVRNQASLKVKTDMLETLAMQDGLTDIPNRRFFEERFSEELKRAERGGHALSILMMDIDSFKSYNDNYGHGAGDDCLRRVARTLKSSLERPMDLVARYGGEEFVVLLPETDAEGAQYVGEKLNKAVESQGIVHEKPDVAPVVTISVGAATCSNEAVVQAPTDQTSTDNDGFRNKKLALQRAADQALYQAKQLGRNRVHSA